MRIAIDYDGTYTKDPIFWDGFIRSAIDSGHEIICVTMRHPEEKIEMPCEIIYTMRRAKAKHMQKIGRIPDIWIDDNPHWIFVDSF